MTNWRFYNDHENEKKYSYKSNNISNKHDIWNSIRIVLLIGFGLGLFKPIDLKSNDFKLKEFKPIDLKSNDFKLNDE